MLFRSADAKRAEDEQRRAKRMVMWVLLGAFLVILAQLGGMVGISFAANEATKESHVREGGVMAALDGEVVKTAESTVACRCTWPRSCPSASASRSR